MITYALEPIGVINPLDSGMHQSSMGCMITDFVGVMYPSLRASLRPDTMQYLAVPSHFVALASKVLAKGTLYSRPVIP